MTASDMGRSADEAAGFLKALANRHRLLVLCCLSDGEKSVSELEALVGVRQPHLSQQLARLREGGLVQTRRDSRTVYYRLGNRAAERLIGVLHELFGQRPATAAAKTRAARSRTGNGRARD